MGYTGMGMVPEILNLCYTIPIPMVSWVFMKSTLKCSISVENELFLSQTSYPSVIYEYLLSPIPIPVGSAIHAQWPVPSAAIPQKLKCYILAMDQLSLLKTWNPHSMYIIIPLIQNGSAIHAQWPPSPATPQKSILATDPPPQVVRIFSWTLCHPP